MADWPGKREPVTIEIRGGKDTWPASEQVETDLLTISRQRQDEVLENIQSLMQENRTRALEMLKSETSTQQAAIKGEIEESMMDLSRDEQERILLQLESERGVQEGFIGQMEKEDVWKEHERWVRETDAMMLSRKRQDAILNSLRKRKRKR